MRGKCHVLLAAISLLTFVVGLEAGEGRAASTELAEVVLQNPEGIDADTLRVTVFHWKKYDEHGKGSPGVIGGVKSSIQLPELPAGPGFYHFRLDAKSRHAQMWLDPPALRVKAGKQYAIRVRLKHQPTMTGDELQDALATRNWKRAYKMSDGYGSKDYESLLKKSVGRLAGFKDDHSRGRLAFTTAREELFSRWKHAKEDTTKTARIVGLHAFYLQPEAVIDDLEPLLSAVRDIRIRNPENWRACLAESSLLYRMERFDASLEAARRILKIHGAHHIARANAYHRCAAILYVRGEHEESLAAHEDAAFPLFASGLMEAYGGTPGLTPLDYLEANIILCESVMRFQIPYAMISARKELVKAIRASHNHGCKVKAVASRSQP